MSNSMKFTTEIGVAFAYMEWLYPKVVLKGFCRRPPSKNLPQFFQADVLAVCKRLSKLIQMRVPEVGPYLLGLRRVSLGPPDQRLRLIY
jgi:hypothetical protein